MGRKHKRLETVDNLEKYAYLDGEINAVIDYLTSVRDQFANLYEEIHIEICAGYENVDANILGVRKENDKEYEKRVRQIEKEDEKVKEKRRKAYEKLKKEFE